MQISIKYVNPPHPQSSGKWGALIDHSGTKIRVPVDRLDDFRAGTTVEVATREQTWFRGTPDEEVVLVATGGPGGSTWPVQRQGGQTGYQRPSQGQGLQRSNTGFQPKVVQGGPMGRQADEASKWIFITGITGRALGSGKFAISELSVLAKEAARVFDELQKPTPSPSLRAEPEPVLGLEPGDPGPEPM